MSYINQNNNFAGFWIRIGASILDLLIFTPIFLLATNLVSNFIGKNSDLILLEDMFAIITASIIITSLVSAAFVSSAWQATPGKRILNMYVTSNKGSKIAFNKAFLRSILPSFLVILLTMLVLGSQEQIKFTNEEKQKLLDSIPNLQQEYEKYSSEGITLEKFTVSISGQIFIQEQVDKMTEQEKEQFRNELIELYNSYQPEESYNYLYLTNLLIKFIVFLFFLWYLYIAFSKEKTALHDIILNTRVIFGKPENKNNEV